MIGASEGLGRALAHALSRVGTEVIVSARDEERLQDLVAELPGKASYVPLDVSDLEAVQKAADEVGQIDGMVFLAGVYWPMKATEWDAEKIESMVDVNFTGTVRAVGAVLPKMIEHNHGHIVLTGSLSGFRGLPGAIGYGASKAGIMYLAESMKIDLKKTDIEVQLVNPGFIKTRLTDKNDFKMPFIMEPDEAAKLFFEHMNSDRFKRNFPTVFSWFFRLSQFLPDWIYFRLFK
nr:SDR family NAD(P)-dependent oxidoreductase [Pseudaestuariivita rosea]